MQACKPYTCVSTSARTVPFKSLPAAKRARIVGTTPLGGVGPPAVIWSISAITLPCDWMSIEKADKMARRAAGLENDETTKVNVSLNLVNQRILAMQQAAE